MVIYADILILVNFVVDYFLLRLTAIILRLNPPLWRTLLSALLAAATSLYIFLPQSPVIIEIIVRALFCLLISLVNFGIKNKKAYLRAAVLFLGVTFGFAGCMAAVYGILTPKNMTVNNSVVYFDISPLVLILSSAAFYFVSAAARFLLRRKNTGAARCRVTLFMDGNSLSAEGIIDSGNAVRDPFTGEGVVLISRGQMEKLQSGNTEAMKSRIRAIPCKTVTGTALLEGYRTDRIMLEANGVKKEHRGIVAAISQTEIAEGGVIVSPDFFD